MTLLFELRMGSLGGCTMSPYRYWGDQFYRMHIGELELYEVLESMMVRRRTVHHHGLFVAQEVIILMLGNVWNFETERFPHVGGRVESLLYFFIDSHGIATVNLFVVF